MDYKNRYFEDKNANVIEYNDLICPKCGSKSDAMEEEFNVLWCSCGERFYRIVWKKEESIKKGNEKNKFFSKIKKLNVKEFEGSQNINVKLKEFEDHKVKYHVGYQHTTKDYLGRKISEYINEIVTNKGKIREELWYKQAKEIIEKYNELDILECLKQYKRDNDYGAIKNRQRGLSYDEEIEREALVIHMYRCFESADQWEGFRKKYNIPRQNSTYEK